MTTPLVFKAFSFIQKLNQCSYSYVMTWDPLTRQEPLISCQYDKGAYSMAFFQHWSSISRSLLSPNFPPNATHEYLGTRPQQQGNATNRCNGYDVMSCDGKLWDQHFNVDAWSRFCPSFQRITQAGSSQLRQCYITSKDIKMASMLKELNPKKWTNQEVDNVGLCMLTIIHILTVIPAVTPLSLVMEDVDPMGVFIKMLLLPDYDSLGWKAKLAIVLFRIFILTVAMLEISQTFRTIFNFGLSVFHIYRKCMEVSTLSSWKGQTTITIYNQLQVLHAGMIGFFTPLGAFFLGLNFIILTVSTVLCLVSYRILPMHIYVGIPGATAMAYFLLFATLPYAIHCHEETQRLIMVWHRQIASTNSSANVRNWKKVLAKLRPISFYCGSMGLLTRHTKRIYMWRLLLMPQ